MATLWVRRSTVTVTSDQDGDITTAIFKVEEAPAPAPYSLSTDVATEGVRIEVSGESTTMVPAGEDLTVQLEKWGLPSSIPEESVLILGQGGVAATATTPGSPAYSGQPASVRIEASNKIVLSLTARYDNGDAAGPLIRGERITQLSSRSRLASPTPPLPGAGTPSS